MFDGKTGDASRAKLINLVAEINDHIGYAAIWLIKREGLKYGIFRQDAYGYIEELDAVGCGDIKGEYLVYILRALIVERTHAIFRRPTTTDGCLADKPSRFIF